MKTPSTTICILFSAALLFFSSCGQNAPKPPAEFASMPVYECSAPRPARIVQHNDNPSIGAWLTDCESQLDRIRDCFAASIGRPHR